MRHELIAQHDFLEDIRCFFKEKKIIEVHTAHLMPHTVVDPYIASISWSRTHQTGYLQTSPEFAMKHLLAQGSGDIFQIAHAFRDDGNTAWHRPEFLMLEWYRTGWDHKELMEEVLAFLCAILPAQVSYIAIKEKLKNYGWIEDAPETWGALARSLGLEAVCDNFYEALDFLVQTVVYENSKPHNFWTVYHDFPEEMSNHAWSDGSPRRFELYYGAIEIANGCQEETRVDILSSRMQTLQDYNKRLGKHIALDLDFLENSGKLGIVSGVAVGLDRLYSLKYKRNNLASLVHI